MPLTSIGGTRAAAMKTRDKLGKRQMEWHLQEGAEGQGC